MTGQPLNFDLLTATANDAHLTMLADRMSDALASKMTGKPGYTPIDQLAVHLIALARCCAVACVTLPGTYEANAKAFCDVLHAHLVAAQASAEGAVKAAYVGQPANKGIISVVPTTVADRLDKQTKNFRPRTRRDR